jgi:hypothetical protein
MARSSESGELMGEELLGSVTQSDLEHPPVAAETLNGRLSGRRS